MCIVRISKPIANFLCEQGLSVSVVNPKLIRDFGDNTLRKPKNDKKDAIKICRYALTYRVQLPNYSPENDERSALKILNRQYSPAEKTLTMHKNLLISYLELVFPEINKMFTSHIRNSDGHEKWIDFLVRFPHADMVAKVSLNEFRLKYKNWCIGSVNQRRKNFTSLQGNVFVLCRMMRKCDFW